MYGRQIKHEEKIIFILQRKIGKGFGSNKRGKFYIEVNGLRDALMIYCLFVFLCIVFIGNSGRK